MSSRENSSCLCNDRSHSIWDGSTDKETLLASSIARSYALQYSESMRSVLMGRIWSQGDRDSPIGQS